ncbi:MAG: hypothetical protein PS018_22825 [bacterium]|nr:hypothetical protein [bacterium]
MRRTNKVRSLNFPQRLLRFSSSANRAAARGARTHGVADPRRQSPIEFRFSISALFHRPSATTGRRAFRERLANTGLHARLSGATKIAQLCVSTAWAVSNCLDRYNFATRFFRISTELDPIPAHPQPLKRRSKRESREPLRLPNS